jgi:hypothetical protein
MLVLVLDFFTTVFGLVPPIAWNAIKTIGSDNTTGTKDIRVKEDDNIFETFCCCYFLIFDTGKTTTTTTTQMQNDQARMTGNMRTNNNTTTTNMTIFEKI